MKMKTRTPRRQPLTMMMTMMTASMLMMMAR
jgi:hypothetical protein